MKKQKMVLTGLAALTFGTVGIATLPLHPVSVQAQSTSDSITQGEIVVHYVDQSGNVLRSATVATGKAGTVYYAPIPNIKGYTYSRVENGQNDSYGAAMIFGGNDTGTGVQEMSIVYVPSNTPAQSDSQTTGSSATGNQTGTTTGSGSQAGTTGTTSGSRGTTGTSQNSTGSTGQSAGNTSQQTTSSTGQSSDATNQTAMSQQAQTDQTGTQDQQSSSKSTKSKQKAKSQQPKKQEKKKATKKGTKKTDQKSDQQKKQPKHHSIVPWIVGGVILVAIVVGAGLWNHRYEPRH